jgi:hypothetical protein
VCTRVSPAPCCAPTQTCRAPGCAAYRPPSVNELGALGSAAGLEIAAHRADLQRHGAPFGDHGDAGPPSRRGRCTASTWRRGAD